MRIDKNTSFAEFIYYVDLFKVDSSIIDELLVNLESYALLSELNISFNYLKLRQLVDLQSNVKNFDDLIFVSFEVLHNKSKEDVLKMSAFDVLRFALFAKSELERISELFKAIEYKPSDEEIKAGILNISNDFVDTAEWYARRMGYKDLDEVFELYWIRIYRSMKKEFEHNLYEKRLRKIIQQKNKVR